MQNLTSCLSGFIPTNPHQYFYVVPNYFNHQIVYYACNTSLQTQTQHQVLASPSLVVPLSPNQLQIECKKGIVDFGTVKRREKRTKLRKSLSQKEEQQQSFNIKIIKNEPVVTYKKKNTESNIVNQTFSFLTSDRSKKQVLRILKDSQKVEEYYRFMAKLKQLNRKYINRNYLLGLLAFQNSKEFEKAFLKAKVSLLTLPQINRLFRVLIFFFLRQQVNLTLTTSGKIYKETLPEHFWRKREIMAFLFEQSHK